VAAADGSVRVIEDTARLLDGCSLLKRLINLRDDEGRTPLYQAAAGGHPSVCKLLLDRDADTLVGPKLLDPALVALAAAPADLKIQRSACSLQSKGPEDGVDFGGSPIGRFVAGIPSATVSQEGCAMFEVEVSELWVGATSSLVVGWSTSRNRKPTFNVHLGHALGLLGVTLVNEAKCVAGGESFGLGEEGQPPPWPLKEICEGDEMVATRKRQNTRIAHVRKVTDETISSTSRSKGYSRKTVLAKCTKPFTVGVAIDLRTRKAHFAFEGDWRQTTALPEALLTGETPLFPAVGGVNAGVKLRFNCGDRPWKFPYPTDRRGESFLGVAAQATGDPPIFVAARAGDERVVELLLPDLMKSREGINTRGCNDGRSLLHTLCAVDTPALVRRLLAKPNMNTDLQDADGMTPLCVAAEKGQAEAVDALLAHDAARDLTTTDGKTAFKLALLNGHRNIAEKLVPSDVWRVALPVVGPLSEIFDALGGDKWNAETRKGWLQDGDVRTWTSLEIVVERTTPFFPLADPVPKVIALNLRKRGGIDGWEVPSRFWSSCAKLQGLSKLDLSENCLAGASISNCARNFMLVNRLCFLRCNFSYAAHPAYMRLCVLLTRPPPWFAGELPKELGNLVNLTKLFLNGNQFRGKLYVPTYMHCCVC